MSCPSMKVKKVYTDAKLPVRAHPTDSGLDVFAYSFKGCDPSCLSLTLLPGDRVLVDTGLQATVGTGFEIQVRPRSGLAYKSGVTVLNSPGTLDEAYRGNIGVILINHSKENFVVGVGEKIAQLVVCPVVLSEVEEVSELPESGRGQGGFGSTGKT